MNIKIYIGALLTFTVLSMAVTFNNGGGGHEEFWKNYKPQNLKVFSKDVKPEVLHKAMENFSKALGVHCDYCHAFKKGSKHLDFVSDEKHEKEIARHMMEMVNRINKRYFLKRQKGQEKVHKISCITCHNGKKHPEMVSSASKVMSY